MEKSWTMHERAADAFSALPVETSDVWGTCADLLAVISVDVASFRSMFSVDDIFSLFSPVLLVWQFAGVFDSVR